MKWQAMMLAGATVAAGCGTTIQPGQRGLKYLPLHEVSLQKELLPEGFYFQWPWNSVVIYDVKWRSTTEDVEVLTKDNLHVQTKVTVTYRPDERQLYRLATEVGQTYYDKLIRPQFVTLSRSEFARHMHNDIPGESPEIEGAILAALRAGLAGKPIEIDRISIAHIEYDRQVAESISKKLATQQAAEQKQYERTIAEQDAEIARTKARGESDAIEIRAEGEALAIEKRAEGEARAIELKGKAQGNAQASIAKTLTQRYLQFKAFDSPSSRYFFVPTGKTGMPLLFSAGTDTEPAKPTNRELVPPTYSQAEP